MAGDDETEVKFYVQKVEASPTGKVLLMNEFLEDLGMYESEEAATKDLVACGDWYIDIGGYEMREYKRV